MVTNIQKPGKFIMQDFYVDDGLRSVDTPEEATKLLNDTRAIYSKGNLWVHKLLSNKSDVLKSFPEADVNLMQSSVFELLYLFIYYLKRFS